MRRSLWQNAVLSVVMAALFVFTWPVPSLAASSVTIGEVQVQHGETVNGNVTANVGAVTVDGHVTGDVINNLGSIVVRGTVGQDVSSNVGEVRIERGARVAGDVRTSLGQISVRGDVAGNVSSAAGQILISGRVGGDVEQEAGEVIIDGEVVGNVRVRQGVVHLQADAVVNGTVVVEEGWVERSSSARVTDVVIHRELRDFDGTVRLLPSHWHDFGPLRSLGDWFFLGPGMLFGAVFAAVFQSIVLILCGLAALALFPDRTRAMAQYVTVQPGASFGIGLLGFVLTPVLFVLLVISILGIIALPFVVIALIFVTLLGYAVAALAIGRALGDRFRNPEQPPWHDFAHLMLGIGVLIVLRAVPYFGGFVSFVAMVAGFGAVLASRFGRRGVDGQSPASI